MTRNLICIIFLYLIFTFITYGKNSVLNNYYNNKLQSKNITEPQTIVKVNKPFLATAKHNIYDNKISIGFNEDDELLTFAAQEIKNACLESSKKGIMVKFIVESNPSLTQGYSINKANGGVITITGSNSAEAMYGGLEVAEKIKLKLTIEDVNHKPFIKKRGIKFNIPIDARSPSYDDSSDASQKNIVNMWDFEGFWKPYLDNLARYRYNVLSLWSCHPYPHMVDLKLYPKVNAQNKGVYRVKEGVMDHKSNGKFIVTTKRFKKNKPAFWEQGFLDTNENSGYKDSKGHSILGDGFVDYDKLTKINDWDINQKIAHWRKVFKHAKNRGIEITIFHWNVYLYGAKGLYGLEESQSNLKTIDYMRYAVKELILTYPEITSIGVAAGEHDNVSDTVSVSTEQYIYKSYGKGVEDALKINPNRKVNFVWRNHSTKLKDVKREFTDKYTGGHVEVSIKYTIGHMYSSRTPQEWQKRAVKSGWLDAGYNVWLNIRNDDTFMHRWGSPSYAQDFLTNMPKESIGFMMGADGYIWAKEFIQKDTTSPLSGILEIDKHWYNFKLWGELAYNNTLDRNYWKATLKHRFNLDDDNAEKLHTAWETVSEIVPQLNRAVWAGNDSAFQAENCMMYGPSSSTGFLNIPTYYYGEVKGPYKRYPMKLGPNPVKGEVQCMSIKEWYTKGMVNSSGKHTPFEVADKLDSYAKIAEQDIEDLEKASSNIEYQDLLIDIKSMAKLGHYYADKQRCATSYYIFRETQNDVYHSNAVMHIKNAELHWIEYMSLLDLHYKPQLTSRTHYLNWHNVFNGKTIGKSIQTVQQETQAIINKDPKYDKP